MERIRSVIIDDEEHCRLTLMKQIEWSCPQVEIIGFANSVENGILLIDEETPDLVFLDIEMSDGTGFDILKQVRKRNFKLIFTTAFDEYAVKAFKVNAIAYLLKPIDGEELSEAIEKIQAEKNDIIEARLEKLMQFLSSAEKSTKIALPVSDGLQFVNTYDIIRCEADGNYCMVYLKDKSKILISKTIKYLENLIQNQKFIRVHQSHLVNIDFVKKYVRGKNGQIILDDKTIIPVSRSKKDDFLDNIL